MIAMFSNSLSSSVSLVVVIRDSGANVVLLFVVCVTIAMFNITFSSPDKLASDMSVMSFTSSSAVVSVVFAIYALLLFEVIIVSLCVDDMSSIFSPSRVTFKMYFLNDSSCCGLPVFCYELVVGAVIF